MRPGVPDAGFHLAVLSQREPRTSQPLPPPRILGHGRPLSQDAAEVRGMWTYQVTPGQQPVQVLPFPVVPRPGVRPAVRRFRLIQLILANIRRKQRLLARARRPADRRLLQRSIAAERRQLRLLLGLNARAGFFSSLSEIEAFEGEAEGAQVNGEVGSLMEAEMEVAQELRQAMAEAEDEEARSILMEIHMETMEGLAGLASLSWMDGAGIQSAPDAAPS